MKSHESIPLTNEERENKIKLAEQKYGEFLDALGYDWRNDIQMEDTPKRVAKMYVNELFAGSFTEPPKIQAFDNTEHNYTGMVFQGNITVNSVCAHHIVPFVGKAYVAYIPSPTGKVIGLSKINRIVDYFCRRPQIQENLTMQIHKYMDKICEGNLGVAVYIEAEHLCVQVRGAKQESMMKTAWLSGGFKEIAPRNEFYQFVFGGR